MSRLAATSLVVLLGLVAAGCTTTPVAAPEQPDVTAANSPGPETPGTTSGPLQQSHLPSPSELGPRWSYRVDPGSVEDGYVGSGAPAIAREPAEVVAALTPLGCRPADLPLPAHALEVTYQRGATPGVGLLLEFDDSSTAQRFFTVHTDALRSCLERNRVNGRLAIDGPSSFVSVRKERLPGTPTWTEGIHLDGARALLVAAADSDPESVARAIGR